MTTDPARHLMIGIAGTTLAANERALLSERPPGGVCLFGRNVVDARQVAELTAELRQVAGDGLRIATDQEGGGVVRLRDLPYPPSAMALGAAHDTDLTRRVAAATGRGLRGVGIDVNFAPVADVNTNPRNPVIADRAFGSDPERVALHVAAFVRGLQNQGVAAVAKHFPGHGDVDVDSHLDLPVLRAAERRLASVEIPPFAAAVQAGTAGVMSAHILVPAWDESLPATLSPAAIRGVLRDRLGFDGVVFTDALEMAAVASRWSAGEAAVAALVAGVDMPVQTEGLAAYRAMLLALDRAVADGALDPAELARSRNRLDQLAHRFSAGTEPAVTPASADDTSLLEAARRGLVAVGTLPVLRPGSRVALVAAEEVRASAASQLRARPAEAFAAALEVRGVIVVRVGYGADGGPEVRAHIADTARSSDAALFVSTSRTRMAATEIDLANATAFAGRPFCHVALWNPYHVRDLPGPALVTFSFAPAAARAAAEALMEGGVSGHAPIPLVSADGMTAQG